MQQRYAVVFQHYVTGAVVTIRINASVDAGMSEVIDQAEALLGKPEDFAYLFIADPLPLPEAAPVVQQGEETIPF